MLSDQELWKISEELTDAAQGGDFKRVLKRHAKKLEMTEAAAKVHISLGAARHAPSKYDPAFAKKAKAALGKKVVFVGGEITWEKDKRSANTQVGVHKLGTYEIRLHSAAFGERTFDVFFRPTGGRVEHLTKNGVYAGKAAARAGAERHAAERYELS